MEFVRSSLRNLSLHTSGQTLTSNRQLGAASRELQEVSALGCRELAHGLEEILDTSAVHVEAMIGFDGIHESCSMKC